MVGPPTKMVGSPTKKVGSPTKMVGSPTKMVGSPMKKGRLAYKNHRPAFENSSRSFKKHQSKKSPKLMLQIHQCGMLVPKLIVCGFYRIYLGLAFMHFVIQIIHIMLIRHSLVYNLICISKQSYLTLYIKYTFSHPTFN